MFSFSANMDNLVNNTNQSILDGGLQPSTENEASLISNEGDSLGELIFIGLTMTIMSLLVVLGNVAVIWLYFKNSRLQQPKNFFILSLAVADIIIGLIPVNFYTIYLLYGYWPLGVFVCNVWLIIDYWACTVSTLSLLTISYERFYFTWFPLQHRLSWTGAYVKKVIIGIWVLAFLIWAPAILIYPYARGEHTVPSDQCYIQFLLESGTVTLFTAFCSYYGPVLFTTLAYVMVSCKLLNVRGERKVGPMAESGVIEAEATKRRPSFTSSVTHQNRSTMESLVSSTHHSILNSVSPSHTSTTVPVSNDLIIPVAKTKASSSTAGLKIVNARLVRRSRRSLKLLLLIILAFSVSWLPYYLSTVVVAFTKIKLSQRLWRFCYIIGWGNSFLNPLCYAFGSKLFKQGLVDIVTCNKYRAHRKN